MSRDLTVSAFFTQERRWNVNLLSSHFAALETNAILRVPIGPAEEDDQMLWRFTEDGIFSVKSGYLTEIDFYETHPSMVEDKSREWNDLIWSTQVPPKVRIFMWKVFNNFIPVGLHLQKHHVPAKPACILCGKDWATAAHTLFFCEQSANLWRGSQFWRPLKRLKHASTIEIGRFVFAIMGKQKYQTWVMATWMTWSYYCSITHNEGKLCKKPSLDKANELQLAFVAARKAFNCNFNFGILLGERKWHPPEEGVFRVDVDVAFDKIRNLFGVGVVVRDAEGKLVAALAKPFLSFSTVLEGEIHAAVEGLSVCIKAKAAPLVLFSDSILAVKALLDTNPHTSALVEEEFAIMEKAKEECFLLGVSHMFRSANNAAHCLAKFAKSCKNEFLWMSSFPPWLRELAVLDLE